MVIGKTPYIVKRIYYSLFWNFSRQRRNIYLTFDDGPTPLVTDEVLHLLDKYQAKATFFCLGRNVDRHPDIYSRILAHGHSVGNHTYSHLQGWKCSNTEYYNDIDLCATLVKSRLFRPPYGKIKRSQLKYLKNKYRIIMWDVMSYDFQVKYHKFRCWKIIKRYTIPGSIVVFHDSEKARERMLYALNRMLSYYGKKGYTFRAL